MCGAAGSRLLAAAWGVVSLMGRWGEWCGGGGNKCRLGTGRRGGGVGAAGAALSTKKGESCCGCGLGADGSEATIAMCEETAPQTRPEKAESIGWMWL